MSSLTFDVAESVSAIIEWPPYGDSGLFRIPDRDGDAARFRVVQRRELDNISAAHLVDHAFADTAMQVADELGIGLGEFTERAVHERQLDEVALGPDRRIEPEAIHLGGERLHARTRARPSTGLHTPRAT